MLDNGFPLATELNVLKEMIRPPSMLRAAVDSVTGGSHVSSTLPTGQLSNVPWRRVGVKYANNEVSVLHIVLPAITSWSIVMLLSCHV